jgi:hypothetical protein
MSHYPKPARVRGYHSANRCRIARAEVYRKVIASGCCHLMQLGKSDTGFCSNRPPNGIHFEDLGQTAEAHHYLAGTWNPATDQPRVASLGYDPDPGLVAQGEYYGNLIDRSWACDC